MPCSIEGKPWLEALLGITPLAKETDLRVSSVSIRQDEPSMRPSRPLTDDVVPTDITTSSAWSRRIWNGWRHIAAQLLRLGLTPNTLEWFVEDYFWRAWSWMENIVYKGILQSWTAHPLLTAGAICLCFNRVTGDLIDETRGPKGEVLRVDPAELAKLAYLCIDISHLIVETVAKDPPSHSPLIPLDIFIEAWLCFKQLEMQYARLILTQSIVHTCCLFQALANWEILKLDFYDPTINKIPPNAYIRGLWYDEDAAFVDGTLGSWRQVIRRTIWALTVDDNHFFALLGTFPKLLIAPLSTMRLVAPDTWMVEGAKGDWDNCYGERLDLSWAFLDRRDLRRRQGMIKCVGNLKETEVAVFGTISMLVLGGVNQASLLYDESEGSFHPMFHGPGIVRLETCETFEKHPLQHWRDFVQDILETIDVPLRILIKKGDTVELWNQAREFWGERLAARFYVHLTRMLDARIKTRAWTPSYTLLPVVNQVLDISFTQFWSKMGQKVVVKELRGPSRHIAFEQGPDWFKLLQGERLEEMLGEAIVVSQLLRNLAVAIAKLKTEVRLGHAHVNVAMRTVLAHVAVVIALKQKRIGSSGVGQVHEELMRETLEDVKVHLGFLKEILTLTGSTKMGEYPLWMRMLEQKATELTNLDVEFVKSFYQATLLDSD